MTKQLPQEIRTAVLKVAMAFTKNIEDVEKAVFTINHYLGVYLSLPQQEEPKQIEKIDGLLFEKYRNKGDEKTCLNIVSNKLDEVIDIINSLL